MIVKGLELNAYYLFNPVWVDLSDAPSNVTMVTTIDGVSNSFELYTFDAKARFDISKLVLGLIDNVKNKNQLIGNVDGAYKVDVRILQNVNLLYFKTIYFLLGGKKGYETNIGVSSDLSLNNKVWDGFPQFKSIFSGGQIGNVLKPNLQNLRPRVDCDNVFFSFRNNKAGFSCYLFEDYSINDDNKNKGYYLTQNNVKVSGLDASSGITVSSKVHRDFYEAIRSLADSFEIYVYNTGIFETTKTWVRVNGSNNKVSFNSKNIATDITFNFDLITNFNKVW